MIPKITQILCKHRHLSIVSGDIDLKKWECKEPREMMVCSEPYLEEPKLKTTECGEHIHWYHPIDFTSEDHGYIPLKVLKEAKIENCGKCNQKRILDQTRYEFPENIGIVFTKQLTKEEVIQKTIEENNEDAEEILLYPDEEELRFVYVYSDSNEDVKEEFESFYFEKCHEEGISFECTYTCIKRNGLKNIPWKNPISIFKKEN